MPPSARPLRRAAALLVAAALPSLLAACTEEPLVCTLELRVSVTPRDTTVVVGAGFTPRVELTSCGGRQQIPTVITLTSGTPSVVQVGTSGRSLAAIAPGTAVVQVTDATHGDLGTITVRVEAAP